MANIPLSELNGIFTRAFMGVYRENIPAPSFLQSFFGVETNNTKYVGIEVMRGTEKIAADVIRGTDGNRNQFSLSTEKLWMPPMYNENFDQTSLDVYDRAFGQSPEVTPEIIGGASREVGEKLAELRKKIERAKELQAAQVFDTGIVTLQNGDNVDFKRRSISQVDVGNADAGEYWNNADADIEAQLIAGAEFVRNYGKNGTGEFDMIMSGTAWLNMKKSNYFTNPANWNQVKLVDVNSPRKDSFGAGYHGQVYAGAYTFNVWTYDEVYESDAGVKTRYWPSDTAVIVPVNGTRFTMSHAGIPAILRDPSNSEFPDRIGMVGAEYWVNNYIDPKAKAHIFEIMSAPLAVPVTVDMLYTMTVLNIASPLVG